MIYIWTDGACEPNPGNGGWASIIKRNNSTKILQGKSKDTTNNRMELEAVIQSLKSIEFIINDKIEVISDSKYVVNGATSWMYKWNQNNWKIKKQDVKNSDLWKILYSEVSRTKAKFKWVKGHNGHHLNEEVDKLATAQILLLGRNPPEPSAARIAQNPLPPADIIQSL